MKKLLLLFIILISAVSLNAQVKQKLLPFKFTTEVNKLPINFNGMSLDVTFNNILNNLNLHKKGEFETTNDYNVRIKRSIEKITKEYYFTAKLKSDDIKYDIDNSEINIYGGNILLGRYNGDEEVAADNHANILLNENITKRKYVGTNGYGAKTTVESSFILDWYIAEDKLTDSLSGKVITFNNININEGKLLKNNCRMLVIGVGRYPFLEIGTHKKTATVSDPYEEINIDKTFILYVSEIWFYNYITGKIYLKFKSSN